MDFDFISPEEQNVYDLMIKLDQTHIIQAMKKHSKEERQGFISQVNRLNQTYPGGLECYYNRARKLLEDSLEGVNPYEGFTPSPPPTENVHFGDDAFMDLESIGKEELQNTCFVLVAGGLGERLGYDGVKIEIPLSLLNNMCFLEYYIRYIEAFQQKYGYNKKLPLAIMTSDDTHSLTVKLLEDNNYFGMPKEMLTIIKQEKVPALLDNGAHFALIDDKLLIETKPHGHGDVHTLLYQYGLVEKWHKEGKKWVIFFQDTNPLIFRSIPAILGVSRKRNFEMNSVVVPRKIGEAVGALCTLSKDNQKPLTINVEYNQLDSLFKALGGEKTDERGYSVYPGNINTLIFSLEEYNKTLLNSKGNISEFINPKYADSAKTKFKSPTRLECMMQDYPKLLQSSDRVGVTQIDKIFAFSACKNDLKAAAEKSGKDLPPECAGSCEQDFYKQGAEVLKLCGFEVEDPKNKIIFAGIKYDVCAKILLMPSFGVTLAEIKSKIKGKNYITNRSSMILDGQVTLENVEIDGSVSIKGNKSLCNVKFADQNYVEFVETLDINEDHHIKIRGYKVANHKDMTIIS